MPPEVIPADVPSKAEQVSQPRRTRRIYWLAGLIAFGVIVAAIWSYLAGARSWRHLEKAKSALEEVWSPLLTSSKPILFCVGEKELFYPS